MKKFAKTKFEILTAIVASFLCVSLSFSQTIYEKGAQTGQEAQNLQQMFQPQETPQAGQETPLQEAGTATPSQEGVALPQESQAAEEEAQEELEIANKADEIALPRHMSVEIANIPSSVVLGEPFNVTLLTKTYQKIGFEMQLRLGKVRNNSGKSDAVLLSENPVFDEVAQGEFLTTLWFVLPSKEAVLSDASVILRRNGEFFQSRKVFLPTPQVVSFEDVADFSGLVGANVSVKNFKVSRFNATQNIVTMELQASNSNLKNFALKGVERQGFSAIRGNFFRQSMQFWALINQSQTAVEFSYFESLNRSLTRQKFEINIEELGDNANTELNPNQSSWALQKQITLGVLSGVFFALGVWRALSRKKLPKNAPKNAALPKRRGVRGGVVFWVFSLLFAAGILTTLQFNEEGNLRAKSVVRILPMQHSTIFFIAQDDVKVEVLKKEGNFTKIKFENKIGWTLNENIQQN